MLRPIAVTADSQINCSIYVSGSLRGAEGKEYYLFPGEYEIRQETGALLIHNSSTNTITIPKGTLLTRGIRKSSSPPVCVLDSWSVAFRETEFDDSINCNPQLSKEDQLDLQQLLSKYSDCFSSSLKDLGYTTSTEMVIELEDSDPVVYRPYRMSFAERSLVRKMVAEMADSGIVRESSSPYASPIVLVQKKTGDKRLCVDYRALNRKTKKDPLPRVEDQLDLLAGNTLFTSLDLASGYYQIPIA